MHRHELLGQLSRMQQMMVHLLESVPEGDAYTTFAEGIPPLAWLLGRSVYVETYWTRNVLQGEEELTALVRPLFATGVVPDQELCSRLPPREHLLNWALELQDRNLTDLANPGYLPVHSRYPAERIPALILQEQGRLYELMLAQLTGRQLRHARAYCAGTPLTTLPPSTDHADMHRGVYRVGARQEDQAALDNELPTQMVELDAFRIDREPVTNGAFLGFMKAGGYEDRAYWSDAGWAWRETHSRRPYHWWQDKKGAWYGVGLNGPFDLLAGEPVAGLSHHEAHAYANWVSSLRGELAGAVLQHEYQWETALRSRVLGGHGRVWEWCANEFHPYTGYAAPKEPEAVWDFTTLELTLRGGSLHSQPLLRRPSYRQHLPAEQRCLVSGIRLVFPASRMIWE